MVNSVDNSNAAMTLMRQGKDLPAELLVGWRIKLRELFQGVEGGLIVGCVPRKGKSTLLRLMRDGHAGYLLIDLARKPTRMSNLGTHFELVERAKEGPTRSGTLVKRAMRSGRNWRKRTFVLDKWSGILEWFKPVRGALPKNAVPLGSFELSRPDCGMAVRVLVDEAEPEPNGKKFCFEIYSERFAAMRLMMSASSNQEMRNWCTTITAAIAFHEQMDKDFGKVERKMEMSAQEQAVRRARRGEGLKLAALARERALAERGKVPDVAELEAVMMGAVDAEPWDSEAAELIAAVRQGVAALQGLITAHPPASVGKEVTANVWSAVETLDDPPSMCLKSDFANLVRETIHDSSLACKKRVAEVGPLYAQMTATLEAAYDWLDEVDKLRIQEGADGDSSSDADVDDVEGGAAGAVQAAADGDYWQQLEKHGKLFLDDQHRDKYGAFVTTAGDSAEQSDGDGGSDGGEGGDEAAATSRSTTTDYTYDAKSPNPKGRSPREGNRSRRRSSKRD